MSGGRDVTTGATGMTMVASKFSDTLTLSQPRGENFCSSYRRGAQIVYAVANTQKMTNYLTIKSIT